MKKDFHAKHMGRLGRKVSNQMKQMKTKLLQIVVFNSDAQFYDCVSKYGKEV